jgi:hypothetical protein
MQEVEQREERQSFAFVCAADRSAGKGLADIDQRCAAETVTQRVGGGADGRANQRPTRIALTRKAQKAPRTMTSLLTHPARLYMDLIAHRCGSTTGNDALRQSWYDKRPPQASAPYEAQASAGADNAQICGFLIIRSPIGFPTSALSASRVNEPAPDPVQLAIALRQAIALGAFRPSHWPSSGFCFRSTRASGCVDASPDGRPPAPIRLSIGGRGSFLP